MSRSSDSAALADAGQAAQTARADRITAIVLFALGVAMLAGGFFMERLEVRRIHPASVPGLVPMLLGATLALCAALLYRSAGTGVAVDGTLDGPVDGSSDGAAGGTADGDGVTAPAADATDTESWTRLGAAAAWSVVYALLLVGTLPFVSATALYVGAFAAGFGWPAAPDTRARALLLAKAAALGTLAAWGIATLFSEGFLVRLP